MSLAYHLTFRAVDGRNLTPTSAACRALASLALTHGERHGLLAFRASGDHLHVLAADNRAGAGLLARTLAGALTRRLGLPGFEPARLRPVEDRRHLENAFFYILRNADKHHADHDPVQDASSLGALLDLRVAPPAHRARVRAHLPTLTREALLPILGVAALQEAVTVDALADAAAGAVGREALDGSAEARQARAAACRVGATVLSRDAVAQALGVHERTVRRALRTPGGSALERMIRLRMGHRAALGERANPARAVHQGPPPMEAYAG